MTVTVKDIDAALDKYKGLTLFLAGVRSTLHETASLGIKHYIRAEAAEAHAKELEEIINKAKVDPNAEQTGDPAVDNSYTGQIAQLRGCLEAAEAKLEQAREILTKHKCSSICTEEADGTPINKLEKAGVPCLHCEIQSALENGK